MLRGPVRATTGILAALMLVVAAAATSDASPGGGVTCMDQGDVCFVTAANAGTEGASNTSTGGGSTSDPAARVCRVPGSARVVPCQDDLFGWFSNQDGCYYRALTQQPAPDNSIWQQYPAGGTVYQRECMLPGGGSSNSGWVVLPNPPAGFGAVSVTPADLAVEAVEMLELRGPAIGIAPPPGSTGLVGLPVWLWTEVTPSTWGPASATASVPGLSVTATARATRMVWDMGDGTKVTCRTPGTPYSTSYGGVPSPTCGHLYTRPSAGQPDDAYPVTATTTWEVSWSGGGASGVITVTRSSSTSVRIGELQVLVS